jgi:hypothetical protein
LRAVGSIYAGDEPLRLVAMRRMSMLGLNNFQCVVNLLMRTGWL